MSLRGKVAIGSSTTTTSGVSRNSGKGACSQKGGGQPLFQIKTFLSKLFSVVSCQMEIYPTPR